MEASAPSTVGLRAFHKARTRQTISDVATRLFIERGFENVTVAHVAAAAEVSVKTVFNYFPSKEELFFDRADDVLGALVDAVVHRAAGTTVVGALHALFADRRVPFDADGWRALRDPDHYAGFRSFLAAEHASPALRARRLVIAEEWTDRLAAVLGPELGIPADDPRAHSLAAMVICAMGQRSRELADAMLEGASARQVERRVRAVADEAFGRIALAYADVDAPRPG